MKKYSKGTTLIEIMVSLALISVVLIFMFNILSDLKVEDRESTRGSEDSVERASYTRIIQNDLINLGLKDVKYCGVSGTIICYTFTFDSGSPKNLEVYDNYIIYDNEKWVLDSTTFNKAKSSFCVQESENYQLIRIIIPTNLNPSLSRKLDIEVTYAANKKATIASNITKNCN